MSSITKTKCMGAHLPDWKLALMLDGLPHCIAVVAGDRKQLEGNSWGYTGFQVLQFNEAKMSGAVG